MLVGDGEYNSISGGCLTKEEDGHAGKAVDGHEKLTLL